MITETVAPPPTARASSTAAYLLKLLSGPAAFALVMMAPIARSSARSGPTGGDVEMKQMIRVGIIATAIYTTIAATIHLMMSTFI